MTDQLNTGEQARLDANLNCARRYHHLAWIMASASLLISVLETQPDFQLPLGNVSIPAVERAVAMYITTIALVWVSDRFFREAFPWLRRDPRRVSFPWFPITGSGPSYVGVTLHLLAPVLIAAIAAFLATEPKARSTFLLAGLVMAITPRLVGSYLHLIRTRQDHRGGSATFSIWLLYCYRLVRSLAFGVFVSAPVLAAVPRWEEVGLTISGAGLGVALILLVPRLLGIFAYRLLDRLGVRFGFRRESQHYK